MVRKIFVVMNGRFYDAKPVMAFSDENEACDFSKKLNGEDYLKYINEVQLTEGSVIDELLRGFERALDRKIEHEGIEITGIEFEGDNA